MMAEEGMEGRMGGWRGRWEEGKGREEPTPTAPLSGLAYTMPAPWKPP